MSIDFRKLFTAVTMAVIKGEENKWKEDNKYLSTVLDKQLFQKSIEMLKKRSSIFSS